MEIAAPVGDRSARREVALGEEFTVSEAVEAVGMGRFQALLLLVVGMCVAGKGATITLGTFIFPGAKCDFGLSDGQESQLTIWVLVGIMIGSYTWGLMGDMAGRKISIAVATAGGIATSAVATVLPNVQSLSAVLLLLGFTMAGQLTDLAYLFEYTPTAYRGKSALAMGLAWALGTLGNAVSAWLIMPHYGWRILVFVTDVPYVCALGLLHLVPESAHYLAVRGREAEARKALERMAEINGVALPAGSVLVAPEGRNSKEVSVRGILEKSASSLKMMFAPSCLQMSIPTVLVWVVSGFMYTSMLLMNTEVHATESSCTGNHKKPLYLSNKDYHDIIIVSCSEAVSQVLPIVIIDRIGRKWSMFTLFVGAMASMIPILSGSPDPTWPMFGIRAFAQSIQLVVSVYTSEAYPTDIRAFALGVGHSASNFGTIGTPLVAQGLLHSRGIRASVGVLVAMAAAGTGAAAALPFDTTYIQLEDTAVVDGRTKDNAMDLPEELREIASES
ncbi:unnamed protein product [Ostreobium quekettii]|uniref:Major facilitator superfamily (MFS) profile domain-containing protein n=1 Tax=Ostreobium quekettii TaxID=121088 RepID=A0A8S1IQS3_9CHLO|nr:unnamed protein product [Ostreobium quekettii]